MSAALSHPDPVTPHSESTALGRALGALQAGRPVLVVGAHRGAPVEVLLAASAADASTVAWMVRHSSGVLCAPLTAQRARALRLPHMASDGHSRGMAGSAVSIDAARGITTGISAIDRACTFRLLADPTAAPDDLVRPGHVIPLIAAPRGVLDNPGRAETAVDLLTLAGLTGIGVLATLVDDSAEVLTEAAAPDFGAAHDMPVVHAADVLAARRAQVCRVMPTAEAVLSTPHGRFRVHGFCDPDHRDDEHLAMVSTGAGDGGVVLVRVHIDCGNDGTRYRCECTAERSAALADVARHGGVLVSVKGRGADRVRALGLAAGILATLGVTEARLPAGDPFAPILESAGVVVTPWRTRSKIPHSVSA